MRIDIIESIIDPSITGRIQDNHEQSIYLPAPLGLLRENHALNYRGEEFEILGELVKQNYQSISDAMSSNQSNLDKASDIASSTGQSVTSAMKTIIDSNIANMNALGMQTIQQSLGIAPRSNYSLVFNGVDQPRDFILEWSFFPKNYNDSKSIENIINVLQKASLPDIINKSYFDSVVDGVSNFISDKAEINDVFPKEKTSTTGLYSVSFKVPRKIKIKLFERINTNNTGNIEESSSEIQEITHLVNFPYELVIRSVFIEHNENNINPPLIKYNDDYFHTNYKLRLAVTDIQIYNSENVNLNYDN